MQKSSGDLLHVAAVRMRVTGNGNLDLALHSLDEASNSVTLNSIALESATNRMPTALANFIDQYIQLEGRTNEIDEVFEIDKIIIYVKPVATGYPQ